MRSDYVLYAVAIIFFIITAAAAVTPMQQLWILTPAVLGLVFIGLGYTQRPKLKAATPTTIVPVTAPPPPPSPPPRPAVAEAVKLEDVKPLVQPSVGGLTEVKGIGEKRAAQLKTLGINSIEDLAKASAEDLAAKLKISPKITKKWIENAKEI